MQERIDGLERSVSKLNEKATNMEAKMGVMGTHIEYLRSAEDARTKRFWAVAMTGAGALIAAFVGWLVGGGMNVK